jgi:hypothetical protein
MGSILYSRFSKLAATILQAARDVSPTANVKTRLDIIQLPRDFDVPTKLELYLNEPRK